jgi:hypothetical protein
LSRWPERSLDGGQNRYSYGTVGTSMGFGGEIVGTCESCGGDHRVATEAMSMVKAQAEAKFHMY